MDALNQEAKLAQFSEFFSIKHNFNINVVAINQTPLPSFEQFIQQMPLPFKIASNIVHIDQTALKPLQGINNSAANQLVEYLHHQTQKIDLLVGYIISQQDEEKDRFQGTQFGGGGLIFSAPSLFKLGQHIELKIFLDQDNTAIYCIGEIIEVVPLNNESDKHHYTVVFQHIREADREVLVRASLHEQSKQLQALAKERNQEAT